ncbi:hypothetical protein M0D69_25095 [Caballeronia sp. SEWSISQ10-4 2]|uniref:hypothetical protein n=1 Tax=Caballeronia sp. SEWSISQ10-4 2 TaxID=2937438 RepID=UPI0026546DF2|nr:hypothetical protein [Caballeronia sp. SEWSISQ10-4 2]MDN7181212.1 hypothetical protein [Caballeronia sp. SEWSISQ10-4 2]
MSLPIPTSKNSFPRLVAYSLLFLIFSGITLRPYVQSGFWYDDVVSSQVWGMVHRYGLSIWAFTWKMFATSPDSGRLLGAYLEMYPLFYFVHNPVFIKLIDVSLVLINVACFGWLLRELKASRGFILTFAIVFVGSLQLRDFFEAIGAFSTLYPSLGIYMIVSLVLLAKWKNTFQTKWLYASVAVVAVSLFIYELNVIYFPVALLLVLSQRKAIRNTIASLSIVVVPAMSYIALELWIKSHASGQYEGTTFGGMSLVLLTLSKQLIAGLPGSFYAFRGYWQVPYPVLLNTFENSHSLWLLGGIVFVLLVVSTRRETIACRIDWFAYFCAAALIILPAVTISMSAKYQKEIIWGAGYLPVYYQFFGVAFFLTAAIRAISTYSPNAGRVVMVMIIALYIPLNVIVNHHMRDVLDAGFWNDRVSLQQALRDGLLNPVQDGDIVDTKGLPPWIGGDLIYQTVQKKVVVPGEIPFPFLHLDPSASPNHFSLEKSGSGWVLNRVAPN